MKGTLDCIPCLVRQAVELSGKAFHDDRERQNWIGGVLEYLSAQDFLEKTPPDLAASFHRTLAGTEGRKDFYKEEKTRYNRLILSLEDRLRERISRSPDPLREALTLAIAGNIIDFGTPHGVSEEGVLETIEMSERTEPVRNDSQSLFEKLKSAVSLLYIGDNSGEIVFDKLFIEQLKKEYPALGITYAVRGYPVLNDITRDDAKQTGFDGLVPVIDNGDDAPGTRLDHVSPEFRKFFDRADVIISKGQGNLETLDEAVRGNLFFLFMAKCPVIGKRTGVPVGSLMCMENVNIIVAVATDDGKEFMDRHFGDALFYHLYDVTPGGYRFRESLENRAPEEKGHADPEKARGVAGPLKKRGVRVVLSRQYGPNLKRIRKQFLCLVSKGGTIQDALENIKGRHEEIMGGLDRGNAVDFGVITLS